MLEIYKLTLQLPDYEKFGLISQMRRCAVSVPANIAEGFKRRGYKDKIHFYNISQGSLEELKYYLILCKELKFIESKADNREQAEIIGRMLSALIQSILSKGS